jgi:N6-adenosine-specific RNA methylase IME4/ParB-like chromosome segregation protein Spo0J
VSEADTAEVIQGRLGWESGDISEADPQNLKPHPKNAEIYGDTDDVDDLDGTFKESVAEKGVLEPLVVTNGKEIVSGHRRWLAARDADLDSVPVRYSEFDDDLAEREALIEFNRQREKTPGQIVNEFEEMLEIERQRGRESQGSHSTSTKNLVEVEGDAQTRAAEKVNADVSGETLRKGKNVKEKAESDDEPAEVREAAREAWDGLQAGEKSFSAAYSDVKDAEREIEAEPETETPELPDETYRAVVIDPPWPVEKIGRDERPDQGKYLDYPTMDIEDIRDLPVADLAADDGAHVYLWATHKHLPDAFEMLEAWGARFECLLTWDKPTGVAPFSWQYNTEHVLFARFGDGLQMEEMGQQVSFTAPVSEHSEKPDVFYDRVRNASPSPRLEMFARNGRDGFDVWGDEVNGGVADGD